MGVALVWKAVVLLEVSRDRRRARGYSWFRDGEVTGVVFLGHAESRAFRAWSTGVTSAGLKMQRLLVEEREVFWDWNSNRWRGRASRSHNWGEKGELVRGRKSMVNSASSRRDGGQIRRGGGCGKSLSVRGVLNSFMMCRGSVQ